MQLRQTNYLPGATEPEYEKSWRLKSTPNSSSPEYRFMFGVDITFGTICTKWLPLDRMHILRAAFLALNQWLPDL